MPSLDFNGVYEWDTKWTFQPGEMQWSTYEFNKQANLEYIPLEEDKRISAQLDADFEKHFKYIEHSNRIMKEDFPEEY